MSTVELYQQHPGSEVPTAGLVSSTYVYMYKHVHIQVCKCFPPYTVICIFTAKSIQNDTFVGSVSKCRGTATDV